MFIIGLDHPLGCLAHLPDPSDSGVAASAAKCTVVTARLSTSASVRNQPGVGRSGAAAALVGPYGRVKLH